MLHREQSQAGPVFILVRIRIASPVAGLKSRNHSCVEKDKRCTSADRRRDGADHSCDGEEPTSGSDLYHCTLEERKREGEGRSCDSEEHKWDAEELKWFFEDCSCARQERTCDTEESKGDDEEGLREAMRSRGLCGEAGTSSRKGGDHSVPLPIDNPELIRFQDYPSGVPKVQEAKLKP